MKNSFLNPMDIDAYIMSAEENFSGADGDEEEYGAEGAGYYGVRGYDKYGAEGEGYYGFATREGVMSQIGGPAWIPKGYGYGQNMPNVDLSTWGFNGAPMGRPAMPPPAPVVPAKTPTPYQVNVVNTTPNPLTVVLFGMNTFLLTPNFGSSVGVIVVPAQANVSYLELLQQSASQPFETSLIRIQTSSAAQLTQILTVTSKDANGQLLQIPIITQSYFSANQFQSTILDVPYPVKIDGNTNLSFTILGNTTATYTFFPANKVNQSRVLGGASANQLYGAPQVPLAVPMFTSRPIGLGGATMIPPIHR